MVENDLLISFEYEMMNIYKRAKLEAKYNATRFFQLAKDLLQEIY
jgi:hypothetical protein